MLKTALRSAGRFGPDFSFLLRRDDGFGRPRTVNDQDLADVLNRGRVQGSANLAQKADARCMLVGHDTNLNQLMTNKVLMNFVHHRRGQAGIADHDDRIERVGTGAQCAALDRSEV